MAFLDTPPSARADGGAAGSYAAVGTFKPGIEIWNLDVMDPLEPTAVLGGPDLTAGGGKKKKGGKKGGKPKAQPLLPDSHSDAVRRGA